MLTTFSSVHWTFPWGTFRPDPQSIFKFSCLQPNFLVFTFLVADSRNFSCVKSTAGNAFSHCVVCLFTQVTAFEFPENLCIGLISSAAMVFFRKSLAVPVSSSTFYIVPFSSFGKLCLMWMSLIRLLLSLYRLGGKHIVSFIFMLKSMFARNIC